MKIVFTTQVQITFLFSKHLSFSPAIFMYSLMPSFYLFSTQIVKVDLLPVYNLDICICLFKGKELYKTRGWSRIIVSNIIL